MTSTATPHPQLNAIGLVVTDMAATIAFYRRLGLAFPDGAESEGHVETRLPGGLRLMLDTVEIVRSFDRSWHGPSGGHRVALAFSCAAASDVDSVHRQLVSAGYRSHLDPFDAVWGMRYASVLDPDGNPAELFAPLS
jgi:catechol 2,3-dioxygenase-like lactoylglutathione lyase family enzyme